MGQRIEDSIRAAAPGGVREVIPIGLANEYLSYFATPEEYDAQHYEGASTLYGPASGPLVQVELARMARELDTPLTKKPAPYFYKTGKRHRFSVQDIGSVPYRYDDGLAPFLYDLPSGQLRRDYPFLVWTNSMTDLPKSIDEMAVPLVSIEIENTPGEWRAVQDNYGVEILTVLLSARDKQSIWCAVWLASPAADRSKRYRFHVTPSIDPPSGYCAPFPLP